MGTLDPEPSHEPRSAGGLSVGSKVFLVVVVVLAAGAVLGIQRFNALFAADEPSVEPGQPVIVEIASGSTASDIATQLAAEGVVDSEVTLRALLANDDRSTSIQAGTYDFVTGMDARAVFDRLVTGPEQTPVFTVTIPEGLTVDQTLQRLADAEDSTLTVEALREALADVERPSWAPSAEELPDQAEPFEGMLFPLTYDFRVDAEPVDVLQRLVDQTDEIVGGLTTPTGGGPYDVLTVASLVERETRVPEERDEVASVIYNRLDEPMRLQIDATVQYALGEAGGEVTFEELETQSPWNTYTTDGLPPTPISGAGRASIEAATDPADTDFRFYVVCDIEAGRHVFTSSNSEHNANVARFRALRDGTADPFCPEEPAGGVDSSG